MVEREYGDRGEKVGGGRGSGRGRERGGMGVFVTDVESRDGREEEWEDTSVCIYERERVGDGRECESSEW